jgi:hypothetical protein
MAKTSASKRVPKTVSKPTTTAAAVADVAAAPAIEPVTAIEAVGIPKRAPKKAKGAAPAARKAKAAAPAKRKPVKAAPVASPAPAADKPAKAHKPKLVRDSFTIPKDEYQVLDALKRRALGLEHHVRKSELLRAGIRTLAAMNDKALLKALTSVPTLKTGRPKAG